MAEKVQTINLLPNNGDDLLTQLLNWALTIGRLLIILTEMVALGTFIYRFTLDMQIVDLHDKIKAESFIVANFQDAEKSFRDIQDRLATIKKYNAIGGTTIGIFSDITQKGKGKITFKDLTVTTQYTKMQVASSSGPTLTQFVNSLKSDSNIVDVTIDKVENNTSGAQILVNLTATLKPEPFLVPLQQTVSNNGNAQTLSQ